MNSSTDRRALDRRGALLLGAGLAAAAISAWASPVPTATLRGALASSAVRARAKKGHAKKGQQMLVYVGTYTGPKSKGIYLFRLDLATGKLAPFGLAAETESPSFLAVAPGHRHLYAVNETDTGAVSAFGLDPKTGKLTFLNQQPAHGGGTCDIQVDRADRNVMVANYGAGSVAVLPIQHDGKLSPASCVIQHHGSSVNPARQEGPHAHCVALDAANRHLLVADLGLDKVMVYRFDGAKGKLTPNDPPFATIAPGSGPRHIAFSPNNHFAYVISEMGSTITAMSYDPHAGTLHTRLTVSTLPEGFQGSSSCAEIQMHPNGRFLYGSNRGADTIAIYHVDPDTGLPTPAGQQSTGGRTPRNFAIDPTGTFLIAANQDSDNLVVFRIDQKTGALTPTGEEVSAPSPVCVTFVPAE